MRTRLHLWTILMALLPACGGELEAPGADVTDGDVAAATVTTTYQAENAALSNAWAATGVPGYTGTAYVDYRNAVGSWVEFTVQSQLAGTATVVFRYMNGGSADRPMDISLNGTRVLTSVAFVPVGAPSWNTWATRTVTLSLRAGANTIRATATTAAGGPHLDRIDATTQASGGTGCTPPAPGSRGTNPLFTDQFTADPAALVDGCTFYVTAGHDEAAAGQNAFVMREWFLLSSTDMVHWTKRVAMSLSTFSWASANAWAGQMVKAPNGRYYWYVPVAERSTGAMALGVAVAASPAGPWTDAIGRPLVNDAFEMSNMGFSTPSQTPFTIDPTVFVDTDGQAYLHYGGFGRMVEARLNPDMVSISGRMQESTPAGFFEAPYLFKRNGLYYEVYAAGANPATIDYATATSPMGPWTRRGRILNAFPRAAGQTDWPTNHAGVAELAGQWYIVYHVSNGPNGGGTYRREVAIDKLSFNADGTIPLVTPSSGLSF